MGAATVSQVNPICLYRPLQITSNGIYVLSVIDFLWLLFEARATVCHTITYHAGTGQFGFHSGRGLNIYFKLNIIQGLPDFLTASVNGS